MAFELKTIGTYLKKIDAYFEIDTEKEVLIVGITDGVEEGNASIKAVDYGCIFSLYMEPMSDEKNPLDIPNNHPHLHLILLHLLYANYMTKFGTWEYNPSDGNLRFAIEFPIENGKITQMQIERIFDGAYAALKYQARFRHILATGTMPEDEDIPVEEKALLDQFEKLVKVQQAPTKEYEDGI